jgi:hypothetical protein
MTDRFAAPQVPAQLPAPPRKPTGERWRASLGRVPLGLWALVLAIVLVIAEVAAITIAADGHWVTARMLAELVIALTVGSFLLGLVAAIRRHGRRLGLIAAALSVLANPLVQIWLLGGLGGS